MNGIMSTFRTNKEGENYSKIIPYIAVSTYKVSIWRIELYILRNVFFPMMYEITCSVQSRRFLVFYLIVANKRHYPARFWKRIKLTRLVEATSCNRSLAYQQIIILPVFFLIHYLFFLFSFYNSSAFSF